MTARNCPGSTVGGQGTSAFSQVRPPGNRGRESRGVLRRWEFRPTPTVAAGAVPNSALSGRPNAAPAAYKEDV